MSNFNLSLSLLTDQEENYSQQGYNQMSPASRSPSGPTYTQLGSAPPPRGMLANAATVFYYTNLNMVIHTAGMWGGWQGNPPQEGQPVSTTAGPVPPVSANSAPPGAAPQGQQPGHPPQHELTDMLQMLGQPEGNSFEDLSMFNSFQE